LDLTGRIAHVREGEPALLTLEHHAAGDLHTGVGLVTSDETPELGPHLAQRVVAVEAVGIRVDTPLTKACKLAQADCANVPRVVRVLAVVIAGV
jgi:hypothetical protein